MYVIHHIMIYCYVVNIYGEVACTSLTMYSSATACDTKSLKGLFCFEKVLYNIYIVAGLETNIFNLYKGVITNNLKKSKGFFCYPLPYRNVSLF